MDHASTIIAGIVGDSRRDRLATAQSLLVDEHIQDPTALAIWKVLGRYYDLTSSIVTPEAFEDLLKRSGVDDAKTVLYTERLATLGATKVPDHEFKYALDALRDVRAHNTTGDVIATAMEILTDGATVDRRELKGHGDARAFLYERLIAVDRLDKADAAPEGTIRNEAGEILEEYALAKRGTASSGVRTGIPQIDATTNGFANGELVIIAAYTGQGKTQLCSQCAWYAAVREGKNVFFATTETVRTQVRRRIIARHSREPQFSLPHGLDSKALRNGTLTSDEELTLRAVVDDITTNPTYGRIHIAQIPRGGTLSMVEARAQRVHQQAPQDLLIIDYLTLLRPDRYRGSEREELNATIRDAKMMSVSFAEGRGIPLVSPWATSQQKLEQALRTGEYTLASLSDTSEAEKSADIIICMLRLPDSQREVKLQFLKSRDSDTPSPFTLEVDYRNSYIGPKATADAVSSLLDDEDYADTSDIDSLLEA